LDILSHASLLSQSRRIVACGKASLAQGWCINLHGQYLGKPDRHGGGRWYPGMQRTRNTMGPGRRWNDEARLVDGG